MPQNNDLLEKLNDVIEKSVDFMFDRLVSIATEGNREYIVINSAIDDRGWYIVLEAKVFPGRMFEFVHQTGTNRVAVSTYIKAHSFFTELY